MAFDNTAYSSNTRSKLTHVMAQNQDDSLSEAEETWASTKRPCCLGNGAVSPQSQAETSFWRVSIGVISLLFSVYSFCSTSVIFLFLYLQRLACSLHSAFASVPSTLTSSSDTDTTASMGDSGMYLQSFTWNVLIEVERCYEHGNTNSISAIFQC